MQCIKGDTLYKFAFYVVTCSPLVNQSKLENVCEQYCMCDDDESAGVLKSASHVSWAVAAAVYVCVWQCTLAMLSLW